MAVIAVLTTVGSEEEGDTLARELVIRRQAACVNMIPGVRSFYRWKGEICRDDELLLVIKTETTHFEAVTATIQELHTYEVPEILAFDVAQGEKKYLDWISGCLDKNLGRGANTSARK